MPNETTKTTKLLAQKVMVSGNTERREVNLDFLIAEGCIIALEMSLENAKDILFRLELGITALEKGFNND